MKNSKSIIAALICMCFSNQSFSQQIGSGFAPVINDFTVPLNSGIYNGINPTQTGVPASSTPDISHLWQHLFVMRHNNQSNNHQLQIASSFAVNDKIYFRKIGRLDLSNVPLTSSPWIELATRGVNTFTGNQYIIGNVGIGSTDPQGNKLYVDGTSRYNGIAYYNSDIITRAIIRPDNLNFGNGGGIKLNAGNLFSEAYIQLGLTASGTGAFTPQLTVLANNGNVGIGTINPDETLTVNGKIHAKEVRIDLSSPMTVPDYVFANDYKLKTLQEIENYVKENNHLPEIPSAKEIEKNGLMLAEMNMSLLKKIEELTLYAIEHEKKTDIMMNYIQSQDKLLSEQNKIILEQNTRLDKLENKE